MGDLFGTPETPDPLADPPSDAPLADRMRPTTIDEYAGQGHLISEGKVLARVVAGDSTQSLILWGPPGVGKTTLARLIAAASGMRFVPYSAVLSGIKEIREVMADAERERAKTGRATLLFIDEIHRFNKAQQDAFLPFVERGDVVLIGATTENPSFEVNGALLSRCRTVLLEPLSIHDLVRVLERAVRSERGLDGRVQVDAEALKTIAAASDGDARRALTLLETVAALTPLGETSGDAVAWWRWPGWPDALTRTTEWLLKKGDGR